MTILTGRQRIGNTSLIKKTFEDSDAPIPYFFTVRKAEAAFVNDFVRETHDKLHGYVPEGPVSVTGVPRHLFELAKTVKFTLVIEEF